MIYIVGYQIAIVNYRWGKRILWSATQYKKFPAQDDKAAQSHAREFLQLLTVRDCGQEYPPKIISFIERKDRDVELKPKPVAVLLPRRRYFSPNDVVPASSIPAAYADEAMCSN